MGNIIAIAGKGGTGKTTIAALIVRALVEKKMGSVLAVDADPNSNLGQMLGSESDSTIVGIIDDISKDPAQIPGGMTKDRYIDLKIQESLSEKSGFDLLSMGRPEGPGCYCFVNNILRGLIEKLMGNYSYIVIDNEAGMEHLSRRLARDIGTFLIISDNTVIGIRSADRISKIVDELSIKIEDRCLILNKARGSAERLEDEIKKYGLHLHAVLPLNEEIELAAIENKTIFDLNDDNPVLGPIKELLYTVSTKS